MEGQSGKIVPPASRVDDDRLDIEVGLAEGARVGVHIVCAENEMGST